MLKGLKGLEDVKVHDLYQHYPNMFIDVAREQRMLRDYDIIIFQHPFYCPHIFCSPSANQQHRKTSFWYRRQARPVACDTSVLRYPHTSRYFPERDTVFPRVFLYPNICHFRIPPLDIGTQQ